MIEHPKDLLPIYSDLAKRELGERVRFEFSKYVYVPQMVSEKREVVETAPEQILDFLTRASQDLRFNEEIALHSRILGANGHRHIPMIDMGCEKIEPHWGELEKAFLDFGIRESTIFHSGRSFHIYGHSLLSTDSELIRFMGRILLLNLPNRERVIDERWVGHRLMAGYLTLRWTNNNSHYKSLPRLYRLDNS